MTFKPTQLTTLAYANGFTLHHYRTTDPKREVMCRGYFDSSYVRTGDKIEITKTIPSKGGLERATGYALYVVSIKRTKSKPPLTITKLCHT